MDVDRTGVKVLKTRADVRDEGHLQHRVKPELGVLHHVIQALLGAELPEGRHMVLFNTRAKELGQVSVFDVHQCLQFFQQTIGDFDGLLVDIVNYNQLSLETRDLIWRKKWIE